MSKTARITSVLLAFVLNACANQALDNSRRTLTVVSQAVRVADESLAENIEEVSERARQAALSRSGECSQWSTTDCVLALYREEMAPYYEAVEALEAVRDALELWESVNEAVADRQNPRIDWETRVCNPIRQGLQTVRDVLVLTGVALPPALETGLSIAGDVCSLGVELFGGNDG